MLHILCLMLKWIGILLGGILGLILLVIGLVLFCPIRYTASAEKLEEDFKKIKMHISVSWLFRVIGLKVRLEEGSFVTKIQLFGIPLEKLKKRKTSKQKRSSKTVTKAKKPLAEEDNINIEEKQKEPIKIDELVNFDKQEQTDKTAELERISMEDVSDHLEELDKIHIFIEMLKNVLTALGNKLKKIGNAGSAIRKFGESIAKKIHKLQDKIQGILDKLNWWKCFLENPKVQAAIAYVKARLWRVCKHIFPTKISGNVTFGNEDPSVTGTVLAVLGITMPFHKNCIEVTPLFEGENVLNGTVSLKGRIYTVVVLLEALKVIMNKNVRYTIKYWKNKEEA